MAGESAAEVEGKLQLVGEVGGGIGEDGEALLVSVCCPRVRMRVLSLRLDRLLGELFIRQMIGQRGESLLQGQMVVRKGFHPCA